MPGGPGIGWTVAAAEPLLTAHGPVRGVPPFTDVPIRATAITSQLVTGHSGNPPTAWTPEIRSWPVLIAYHPGLPMEVMCHQALVL